LWERMPGEIWRDDSHAIERMLAEDLNNFFRGNLLRSVLAMPCRDDFSHSCRCTSGNVLEHLRVRGLEALLHAHELVYSLSICGVPCCSLQYRCCTCVLSLSHSHARARIHTHTHTNTNTQTHTHAHTLALFLSPRCEHSAQSPSAIPGFERTSGGNPPLCWQWCGP